MKTVYILARDIVEFGAIKKHFERRGVDTSGFKMIGEKADLVGFPYGGDFYISAGASERGNYLDLIEHLYSLGATPKATYTPPHIKAMREEYDKKRVDIVNHMVWEAIRAGHNPANIIIEQHHAYDRDANAMVVKAGCLILTEKNEPDDVGIITY